MAYAGGWHEEFALENVGLLLAVAAVLLFWRGLDDVHAGGCDEDSAGDIVGLHLFVRFVLLDWRGLAGVFAVGSMAGMEGSLSTRLVRRS